MGNQNINICLGGLQRNSLIDFPGHIASIVFLRGCNFRCPYCHNPDLVTRPDTQRDGLAAFLDFLTQRRGQIEGVVISGGEPLLSADLPLLMEQIKALGYKIKLDTNGSLPERLKSIIKADIVDYLAMDLKSAPGQYGRLEGLRTTPETIRQSISIIQNAGLPYEFRTTCVKPYVDLNRIESLCRAIPGARQLALQTCRPERVLNRAFFEPPSPLLNREEMLQLLETAQNMLPRVILR